MNEKGKLSIKVKTREKYLYLYARHDRNVKSINLKESTIDKHHTIDNSLCQCLSLIFVCSYQSLQ